MVVKQDYAAEWGPVCSISPRAETPVVHEFVDEDGELHNSLELADWGLHPLWVEAEGPPGTIPEAKVFGAVDVHGVTAGQGVPKDVLELARPGAAQERFRSWR